LCLSVLSRVQLKGPFHARRRAHKLSLAGSGTRLRQDALWRLSKRMRCWHVFARMAVECMHEAGISAGPRRGGERQRLTGRTACAGDAGLARGPERPEDAVQRVRRAVHEVREEALGARAALRASALQRGAEPLRGGRLDGKAGRAPESN